MELFFCTRTQRRDKWKSHSTSVNFHKTCVSAVDDDVEEPFSLKFIERIECMGERK